MKKMHNAEGSSFKFQALPCSKFDPNVERRKQSDAAEACRAHNPEVLPPGQIKTLSCHHKTVGLRL